MVMRVRDVHIYVSMSRVAAHQIADHTSVRGSPRKPQPFRHRGMTRNVVDVDT